MPRKHRIDGLHATASEIIPGLLHLSFDTHKELITTFMRVREFFESSEFKNEAIDLRKFKAWYSKHLGHGDFTYAEDWAAFNLPVDVFSKFKKIQEHLLREEKSLLRFIKSIEDKSYLIATSKVVEKDYRYLRHEIAHFLFASNPDYRREVKKVIRAIDRQPIFKWLKKENYHASRFWDEAHSYLLDGPNFLKHEVGVSPLPYRQAILKLKKIFKKYR